MKELLTNSAAVRLALSGSRYVDVAQCHGAWALG
jgi:hypothetical protein